MVAVLTWHNISLFLASLTQAASASPYDTFNLPPSLAVQQLLITFISTHTLIANDSVHRPRGAQAPPMYNLDFSFWFFFFCPLVRVGGAVSEGRKPHLCKTNIFFLLLFLCCFVCTFLFAHARQAVFRGRCGLPVEAVA